MEKSTLFLLLHLTFGLSAALASPAPFGVNYGQIADNLPTPNRAVSLVKSLGSTSIKLYDANPQVLCAFANSGVSVTVGLGNEHLPSMLDTNSALSWVKTNVQQFLPDTKIVAIAMGNEALTNSTLNLPSSPPVNLRRVLLPAMRNVHQALVGLALDKQIIVTTPHSLAVLESSYPPSAGRFKKELASEMKDVVDFLCNTSAPFLVNAYPFIAYKTDPKQVPLEFVLFEYEQGIVDPKTNLKYDNMLFAQIDAVRSALTAIGYGDMSVHVSETGWPSKGDEDESGASTSNARKYVENLMQVVGRKKGTPMKPDDIVNVHVFALFNENLKVGPTSERYYGIFKPDGTPSYDLSVLNHRNDTSTSSGGGGFIGGGGIYGSSNYSGFPMTPPGYLSFSASTGRSWSAPALLILPWIIMLFL
ncbi:hypothetical protein MLD38_027705 [Melastoma candidum]|uniref:Uncharacterized protein n=1 Tax=Melastoma candidum TaxID=119954 RepID=A0ACB9P711_9MYRT|nr:hypothetical protein MLD38_027705 [Melastoma candidum]